MLSIQGMPVTARSFANSALGTFCAAVRVAAIFFKFSMLLDAESGPRLACEARASPKLAAVSTQLVGQQPSPGVSVSVCMPENTAGMREHLQASKASRSLSTLVTTSELQALYRNASEVFAARFAEEARAVQKVNSIKCHCLCCISGDMLFCAGFLSQPPSAASSQRHERLMDVTNSRIVPHSLGQTWELPLPTFPPAKEASLWKAACGLLTEPAREPLDAKQVLLAFAQQRKKSVADIVNVTKLEVTQARPHSAKSTRSDSADTARGGAWSIRPHAQLPAMSAPVTARQPLRLSYEMESSALHAACWFGQLNVVQCLLEGGVSPNLIAHSALKSTPLHDAASAGHAAVVHCLLTHGADPLAVDSHEDTPLHQCGQPLTRCLLCSHCHNRGVVCLLQRCSSGPCPSCARAADVPFHHKGWRTCTCRKLHRCYVRPCQL